MVDLGLEDSARRRLTATVQSYQAVLAGPFLLSVCLNA